MERAQARSEGAGRVPWKPGLTGPWRVVDVRGHRLTLEPAPDPSGGTLSADCILVPPDAEGPRAEHPVVFEDEDEQHPERPSLGQQVAGEAKQLEFTLTRRGRHFVLRLGDRVAYRGAHGGPKVCRLGKVTQVDQARAQIGVHRYLPEDETGSLTSHEGTRPAHESISVKDVVCKVDVNRDGVLAAASARKLDKGGYSLQEHAAVALCSQDPGLLDVDRALAELLCDGSSLLAQVLPWQCRRRPGSFLGREAARLRGYRVPPCFTHLALSYGIA